ncbi:MAG: hypothetical protein ACREQN_04445 [Candidatus Binataceae bacterium]
MRKSGQGEKTAMTRMELCGLGALALAGGIIGGAMVTVLWGLMPQNHREFHAGKIVTQELAIIDRAGRRRVELGVTKKDTADLDLYDRGGVVRAELSVLGDGTGIFSFAGANGKPSVVLNASARGGVTGLTLVAPEGATRAQIAIQDGEPALMLFNHGGGRLVRIDVRHGQPAISLFDQDGGWRSLIAVNGDGTPDFALADQNGKPRSLLGLQADGRATFALSDSDGKPLALLSQDANGPASFKLMAADGEVTTHLP